MADYQEIYQEIQSLLWSIFPDNSNEVILKGAYYHESDNMMQLGYYNNQKSWVSISINSSLILQLFDLIESLQKCEIFIKKPWNHFCISLNRMSVLDMNFSYIPEEDSWHRLIMKGISDLTEEEWKNTGIPKELWEERVRHKGTGTLGRPQSDFY